MCYYPSPLDQQGLSSLSLSAFCLNRWDWGTKGKKGSLFSLTLPVHKHKPEHRGPTEQDCFHSTHIHWDHMYPHTKADRRPMLSQLLGIYQRWLLTNYLKIIFLIKVLIGSSFFFSRPILKITFLHQCGAEVVLKERLSLKQPNTWAGSICFVLVWCELCEEVSGWTCQTKEKVHAAQSTGRGRGCLMGKRCSKTCCHPWWTTCPLRILHELCGHGRL